MVSAERGNGTTEPTESAYYFFCRFVLLDDDEKICRRSCWYTIAREEACPHWLTVLLYIPCSVIKEKAQSRFHNKKVYRHTHMNFIRRYEHTVLTFIRNNSYFNDIAAAAVKLKFRKTLFVLLACRWGAACGHVLISLWNREPYNIVLCMYVPQQTSRSAHVRIDLAVARGERKQKKATVVFHQILSRRYETSRVG